ncbi:MAG TPA: aminomethyl-transferring glycine dehydrogenase subunit GcvPB [Acidisarcina sp.]|nr:aminomethyl-transferring glycine dehydrogenase subunit GcvPB [Acidisarcina sp.]
MQDITSKRQANGKPRLRRFHQAQWDEPIIFELSDAGSRGALLPEVEEEIRSEVGTIESAIPPSMLRSSPLGLPELPEPQVVRHYLRLSQENLGADLNVDIGQGTCTMKYSPKVNEQFGRCAEVAALHPYQPESTVQGMLAAIYRFEQVLKQVSGLDRFSFQPRSGSAGIYTNAAMIRAYHESRGEGETRKEIITTLFSHPSDAACARVAGFDVITLPIGPNGYPTVQALEAAVSSRTAGMIITNPEDTGIFNPYIDTFTRIVHDAGGLCCYDQANANGILGITRAREAGFDLCQFNLHKTFSIPHGSGGPGSGPVGVTAALAPFLPTPTVEFDGTRYFLDWNRPESIGKVSFTYGCASNVLRAYAWAASLGAKGLLEVAKVAVLNNNYMLSKLLKIPGLTAPFAEGRHRIEQVRYSWEKLTKATGVGSHDIGIRAADYGVHYWTSHHPHVVPEPCTIEPTESYSQRELDEYAQVLSKVAGEAYSDSEMVKRAPHNSTTHRIDDQAPLEDPSMWAMTWRAYRKKAGRR